MKKTLLNILRCLDCQGSDWNLQVGFEDAREVRQGQVQCKKCNRVYLIEDGILNGLGDAIPEEVAHEKEHAESFGYLITEKGVKHPINRETIHSFKDLFLSLPAGDGSHYFKPG